MIYNLLEFETTLTVDAGQASLFTDVSTALTEQAFTLIDQVAFFLSLFIIVLLVVTFFFNMWKSGEEDDNRLAYVSKNLRELIIFLVILIAVWSGALTAMVTALFNLFF